MGSDPRLHQYAGVGLTLPREAFTRLAPDLSDPPPRKIEDRKPGDSGPRGPVRSARNLFKLSIGVALGQRLIHAHACVSLVHATLHECQHALGSPCLTHGWRMLIARSRRFNVRPLVVSAPDRAPPLMPVGPGC